MAPSAMTEAFRVLGVTPDTDAETIRRAWRALVRQYHPDQVRGDKAAANRRLAELNAAFDLVCSWTSEGAAPRATPRERPQPRRSQTEAARRDAQARRKAAEASARRRAAELDRAEAERAARRAEARAAAEREARRAESRAAPENRAAVAARSRFLDALRCLSATPRARHLLYA